MCNFSYHDKLTQLLNDDFFCPERVLYFFVGTLSSCLDKDIVLESLNLIFTNEVTYKFFPYPFIIVKDKISI